MRKLALALIISVMSLSLFGVGVSAIANPDSITFGSGTTATYAVFENVAETGDMLFMAEGGPYYATEPTDYTASQAFIFEILDTTGTNVLLSTPLAAYNDRPIGIYQTESEVSSLGLVGGTSYKLRIRGSPLIFASPTGNSVNVTLASGDYYDDSLVVGGLTPLRNFVINTMAAHMETYDGVTTYRKIVAGITYLSTTGGALFTAGIPGLDVLEPSIFSVSNVPLNFVSTNGTGAYGQSITLSGVWGTTISNGVNAIAVAIGMDSSNGGLIVFFFLCVLAGVFLSAKTQSPLAIMIVIVLMFPIAGLMGLMNLAAAFTISLLIIILGALSFTRNVIA